MKLIGLAGYAQSGKDTAAQALVERGFVPIAFADAVRVALLALNPIVGYVPVTEEFVTVAQLVEKNGWDTAKQNSVVRELLQKMGTEAGRDIHGEYCWTAIACRKAATANRNGKPVVFTDVRFRNEVVAVREMGGKVYRVNRPGVGPTNGHASERLDFTVDGVIENSGTVEQLHERILSIVGT